MRDLLSESVLLLPEVPEVVGANRFGRRLSRGSPWRWATMGLRGPDGSRVRLEAVKLGRDWFTSREAVERFVERLRPAAALATNPS